MYTKIFDGYASPCLRTRELRLYGLATVETLRERKYLFISVKIINLKLLGQHRAKLSESISDEE